MKKDAIKVESKSEEGSMEEFLPVNLEGEEFEVLVNAKFIVEGLKIFDENDLRIEFNGNSGPIIMKQNDFKYLVLPIKMNQ